MNKFKDPGERLGSRQRYERDEGNKSYSLLVFYGVSPKMYVYFIV
jgi:hypothetical protein